MRNNLIASTGCLIAVLPGMLVAGCSSRSSSVASAAVPLPMGGNISGKLAAIDYSSHHLTIQAANGATYKVNASHAPVLVNGREASFADLSPGNSASVVAIAMDQKTLEIEAREVNAVAPVSQDLIPSTSPQPAASKPGNNGSSRLAPIEATKSTATPVLDHPATTRQPVLRPRITDRPQSVSQNGTDTPDPAANVAQPDVTPKVPIALAPPPNRRPHADDGSLTNSGETPGDGTPADPQDGNSRRHRRHSTYSNENGGSGSWADRENRKGRAREWGADAQQMHSDNGDAPHSSHAHSHANGSDGGSEADHLTPDERRDLQRGEKDIERHADN